MSRQKAIQSILYTPKQNTSQNHSNLSQLSESTVHKTLFISDYYSCDPLHSTYSCFACLKRKKQNANECHLKTKSRKLNKNLSVSKMNDIIIKPWHPFLRILQGFFKSDKGKILDRYQGEDNNKLIVEFISCLRSLRTQLVASQELIHSVKSLANLIGDNYKSDNDEWKTQLKVIENINTTIDENYQILNSNSLDIIEDFYHNANLETHPPIKHNMRLQILEQQLRNAQFRLKESERTLDLVAGDSPPTLKSTIQQLIELQKNLGNKIRECDDLKQAEGMYKKEYQQIREENYFLYQLVRLERHTLFLNLMKQYPQDLLQETEVSYFELYLQQLETQISELRVSRARVTAQLKRFESQESSSRKEVEGNVANEQRRQKDQWAMERESYQGEIDQLQNDLRRVERAEREITGTCMKIQNEREQLLQNGKAFQDQIYQMGQVVLNLRNERDTLLQELDMTQNSLKRIESQVIKESNVTNLPALQAQMQAGTADAVQKLCHIILSKQQHLSSEQGEMIRSKFGESAQTVIDQYESALKEQFLIFKDLENQINYQKQENEKLQYKINSQSANINALEQTIKSVYHEVDGLKRQPSQKVQKDQLVNVSEILALAKEKVKDFQSSNDQRHHQSDGNLINIPALLTQQNSKSVQDINKLMAPYNSTIKDKSESDFNISLQRGSDKQTQTISENMIAQNDLNMMVLMQAIAIEEMVKQAENKYEEEEENFSDPPNDASDNQDPGNHKKDFEVIMEQLNEEDEEEQRFLETSAAHNSSEQEFQSNLNSVRSQYTSSVKSHSSVEKKTTIYSTEYK